MYNQVKFTLPWPERLPAKKEDPAPKSVLLSLTLNLQLITMAKKMPSGGKVYGQIRNIGPPCLIKSMLVVAWKWMKY